jgi:hypothetical protein
MTNESRAQAPLQLSGLRSLIDSLSRCGLLEAAVTARQP